MFRRGRTSSSSHLLSEGLSVLNPPQRWAGGCSSGASSSLLFVHRCLFQDVPVEPRVPYATGGVQQPLRGVSPEPALSPGRVAGEPALVSLPGPFLPGAAQGWGSHREGWGIHVHSPNFSPLQGVHQWLRHLLQQHGQRDALGHAGETPQRCRQRWAAVPDPAASQQHRGVQGPWGWVTGIVDNSQENWNFLCWRGSMP